MQRKNETLFGITLLSRQRIKQYLIENEKQNKTDSLSEPMLEDGWCWGQMKECWCPDRENLSLL